MKIYTKTQEILSDTFTPISAFLTLRDEFANVSLFESSDYSSKENSKSYLCVEPIITVENYDGKFEIKVNDLAYQGIENLNQSNLQEVLNHFDFEQVHEAEHNGFYGVIGYDAIPLFEDISFNKSKSDLPDVFLAAYRFVLEFDHFHNRLKMIYNSFDEDINELPTIISVLNKSVQPSNFFEKVGSIQSSETDDSFRLKIEKAKEHVRQGDVFQLVISRQFSQQFKGDDFEVYRQLRTTNPSPYMFYFDLNKAKLIGASPEAQIQVKLNKAEIHPIAGTVKRTDDEIVNDQAIAHLKNDEKENAEHIMLVDLARNDLNRFCENVQVEKLKEVQKFSHVIHLVSKVSGKLKSSAIDVFSGSFPAGTLSGAPKYMAMQLIDRYEAENRKYYGGAIGLISANGDINMAIVIRSALSQNNQLTYQAGAGVVLDSTAEGECQEVYNKVRSVENAIAKANQK